MRPHPLTLFLDFDGTLTHTDTITHLASIPTLLRTLPSPPPSLPANPPPPFSHFTSAYLSALHTHASSYHPPPSLRTTLPLELAYQASLRGVEEASISRIEASGLFKGVRTRDLYRGARALITREEGKGLLPREGFVPLVGRVRNFTAQAGEAHGAGFVVSVNWSRAWIRAVCAAQGAWQNGRDGGEEIGVDGEGEDWDLLEALGVGVVANELLGVEREEGSGGVLERRWGKEGGLWTAGDKVRALRECLEGRGGGWSVYVGDGVGDLGALMECDVGVCMRGEEMERGQRELEDVLERIGVGCEWVGKWREGMKAETERGGVKQLWWARDFREILDSGIMDGPGI
ncbi:hypothetical protein MMC13_006679 [Lambiella insularis]|nr:hypothetical protein [Lambiella insularis]